MGIPLPGTKLQPQSKVLIDISHRGLHGRCSRGGWQSRKQQGTKITESMRAILRNELTDASKTQEAGRHVSILWPEQLGCPLCLSCPWCNDLAASLGSPSPRVLAQEQVGWAWVIAIFCIYQMWKGKWISVLSSFWLWSVRPHSWLTYLKSAALEKENGCSGPQRCWVPPVCGKDLTWLSWDAEKGVDFLLLSLWGWAENLLAVGCCPIHGLGFGDKELSNPSWHRQINPNPQDLLRLAQSMVL